MNKTFNSIMKNVTPSVAVMAVGLAGAFFVYNVYFKNDVNSTFANIEPAAGEEMVMEHEDMTAEEHAMDATEEATEAVEEMAEKAAEGSEAEEKAEEAVEAAEHAEEATEEAAEVMEEYEENDEAVADEMHEEDAKH